MDPGSLDIIHTCQSSWLSHMHQSLPLYNQHVNTILIIKVNTLQSTFISAACMYRLQYPDWAA